MSSTAFQNHCLYMIITNNTFSINYSENILFNVNRTSYWLHMNQIFIKQMPFKQLMILLRRNCALLTLSSCQHQEKHKENQAQSLHVWATKAFRHCCGQADPAFILHLNHGGGVRCARSIITKISIAEWGQSEGLRSGLFIHLIQHLQRPVILKLIFDIQLTKFFNFVESSIVHVCFIFGAFKYVALAKKDILTFFSIIFTF